MHQPVRTPSGGIFVFGLACVYCFFFLLDLPRLTNALRQRGSPARYEAYSKVMEEVWRRLERYVGGLTSPSSSATRSRSPRS